MKVLINKKINRLKVPNIKLVEVRVV